MKHFLVSIMARRITLALTFVALAVTALLGSCAQTTADQGSKLHAMFDEYWKEQMRESPTWATYLGNKKYDSLLTDISGQARERRRNSDRNYLTASGRLTATVSMTWIKSAPTYSQST